MARQKTSIYVDKEVWDRFRDYSGKRGIQVSRILENSLEEEMVEEILEQVLSEMVGSESYEMDFDPVKSKDARVSDLVRTLRNARTNSLLGQ